MSIDLEQIKAAAREVTPGPWAAYGTIVRDVYGSEDQLADGLDIVHARYIAAADPTTVLALIERLERAEASRDQALEDAAAACESQGGEYHSPQYNEAVDDCAHAVRAIKGK